QSKAPARRFDVRRGLHEGIYMKTRESEKTSATVSQSRDLSRRTFLQAAGASVAGLTVPRELLADFSAPGEIVQPDKRFPYFQASPVAYLNVKMQDTFWAPRQKKLHEVTVPWATAHFDAAGGLEAYKLQPATYRAQTHPGDMEAIKFIEAMAAVVGVKRDPAI